RRARTPTGTPAAAAVCVGTIAARPAPARVARGEARDRGAAADRRARRQSRSGQRATPAREALGQPRVLRAARVSGDRLARPRAADARGGGEHRPDRGRGVRPAAPGPNGDERGATGAARGAVPVLAKCDGYLD